MLWRSLWTFLLDVVQFLFAFVHLFFWIIFRLLTAIVGDLQWQQPPWYAKLLHSTKNSVSWCRAHKRQAALTVILLTAVIVGSWQSWQWYLHRPKPVTVDYSIDAPNLTYWSDDRWVIDDLTVTFHDSVAPLENIEKDIAKGITLSPKMDGQWRWVSDRTLQFTPAQDWAVGQEYEISFDQKGLFADKVLLNQYRDHFYSAKFSVDLESSSFYQDPVDPQLKKLTATYRFSHPVDSSVFERKLDLSLANGLSFVDPTQAPLTVTYDKQKLYAYVHSASLAMPREDLAMRLRLQSGVSAERGGNRSEHDIDSKVVVPGRGSLRFDSIEMKVVDNDKFEPAQLISLHSSASISERELEGKVKAWLLPQYADEKDRKNQRNTYWSTSNVSEAVLRKTEALPLSYQTGELEFNDQHNWVFKAPVGRYIYVQFAEGVKAYGGYESIRAFGYVIEVEPYPTILKLMSEGAILSASGSKKIPYVSRGVAAVKYEVGRLLPNQLHHMMADHHGNFATPYIGNQRFDRLVERFGAVQVTPDDDPTRVYTQSINLEPYFRNRDARQHGVYVLRVRQAQANEGDDSDYDEYYGGGQGRLIVITDLGVVAKRNRQGNFDLFVMSIANGRPVDGARVELIGQNGQPVVSDTTDAGGHAQITMQEKWRREKQPLMFVVSKNDDMSFLPLNHYDRQLDFSRFDVGGAENADNAGQLSAYAFSDRNLYRPGETAHLMFIVRTADWRGDLSGVPVQIDITDPRGLTVQRNRIALSSSGFDGLDFVSRDSSLTGEYQLSVSLVKRENNNEYLEHLGGTSFTLREFEPDRLKVRATLAEQLPNGWLKPAQVQAQVNVMHLFGNPAIGATVRGQLTLSGGVTGFAGFSDYAFRDPAKPLQSAVTEDLATVVTNEKGIADLSLNLTRFDKASYRVHVLTTAFEPGSGRGVTAQTSMLVSSADYLVGVKADGGLSYISRGSERNAHWIAVNQNLQKTAVDELVLEWIERKYVSVLARQDNGTYRYVSRQKETLRDSKPSKLGGNGLDLRLATEQPGDYSYQLRNSNGDVVARLDYSVSGAANLSRSLERNAELQINLSKTEFSPGETIELNIRAPYTGAGLITIERDKVFAYQWFSADTSSSIQRIKVPADLEGTAYLNVQFVRDLNSEEVFMSPLSYGVVPFSVNLAARRQQATLTVPKRVKPGEKVQFTIESEEPARVAVIAVDEGILQVAKFQTPDPLSYFFQKRRLQVTTSQILDLILPEFERLLHTAAAGGDAEDLLRQQLNPFKKKRQPPVAWWSGVRDLGAGGGQFEYDVPDYFNGRIRVYTVIASADKIAVYEDGTEVQGDLILNPNVPIAAAPGDELIVTLGVYNNLKGKGEQNIAVKLNTDKGLTVIGSNEVKLAVTEGREKVAEFRVRLNETLGSAALKFETRSGDAFAKISDAISVRPSTPYRTVLRTGSFDKNQQDEKITRSMFAEFRQIETGLAASPLVWAQGLRAYLKAYPHSCTEQITSQAIPALILRRYPEIGELQAEESDSIMRVLRSRQNDAGGFGLWAANPIVSDYVSLHATQFLLEARERGVAVPEDMLQKANTYAQHITSRSSSGLSGARERAYGIYLLARMGVVPSAQLASLKAHLDEVYPNVWQTDLTAAYLAATYKLLKQNDVAWRLMKSVPWQTTSEWRNGDTVYYDPLVHDSVHLQLLSRHFADHVDTVPTTLFDAMSNLLTEQRFHSLSAGLLLLALDQYHQANTAQVGTLAIAAIDKQNKTKPLPYVSGSLKRVAGDDSWKGIRYSRDGNGRAFYVVNETGFDRSSPSPVSQGFEVQRDFVDANNTILTQVKVGDEFFVRLRIRGTAYDRFEQMALVDILPGGIEPVPVVHAAEQAGNSYNRSSDSEECGDCEYEGDGESYDNNDWTSPLGVTVDSAWRMEYTDVRDDRVVMYGSLTGRDVVTMTYRVRATNPGKYVVPAPYAESMYDRKVFAIGKTGTLEIAKPVETK